MSQIPLHSFDLVKLPCSLKLVAALTGIAPGETQLFGVIELKGNYLAACPIYCSSSSPLRAALESFRAYSFPRPQDSQQKFLPELLDAVSQHQPVASLDPCWPGSKAANAKYCQ